MIARYALARSRRAAGAVPRAPLRSTPRRSPTATRSAGRRCVDKDCNACHVRLFGDADRIYTRDDRRVRRRRSCARRSPSATRSSAPATSPKRKSTSPHGSINATIGSSHDALPIALPTRLLALAAMHCRAGAPASPRASSPQHLPALAGWSAAATASRRCSRSRISTRRSAFVNALAWIANREDHHPELAVSYNRCVVTWSTHDAGGVTRNDVICAAKTERLFAG